MDLGYIRLPACKSQQDLDKGIAHLEQAGNLPKSSISLDRSDGKNPDREELQDVLRALHPGDVLHILSLEHLANNIEDLQRIIKKIRDKKAEVHLHSDGVTINAADSESTTQIMLEILGVMARWQKNLDQERDLEDVRL